MKSDFARLLDALGFWRVDGCLDMRALWPGANHTQLVSCAKLENAERIARMWDGDGANVYFGVNPRKSSCGGRDYLKACVTCHADVDGDSLTKAIHGVPLPTALVSSSNNGTHWYWALEEPTSDWDRVEIVNRKLAVMVQGDKCWDSSRILRVPGTTNRKVGREAAPVVLGDCSGERHSLAELERLTAGIEVPVSAACVVPGFTAGATDPLSNPEQKRFLQDGKWTNRGARFTGKIDRSLSDFDNAVTAYLRGANDTEAARVVWHNPFGKAQERGMGYVKTTLERAKERANEYEAFSEAW